MKWEWMRKVLAVLGVLYVWSLIPIGFRPQIADSPVKKSEQTIEVQVENRAGLLGPSARGKIKNACKAPLLFRVFMSSADSARLILKYNATTVGTREVLCKDYVKST